MSIEVNDRVKINHSDESYDGEICKVVRVENGASFPYQVEMEDGPYWMTEADVALVSKAHPATQKQLNYLADLGAAATHAVSVAEASAMIDQAKGGNTCHYCGQPASGFGFFDEAACTDCGG